MVCNVIENCRCYAYRGSDKQFCATHRGPKILKCPEDCCAGGCPDDGSRPPYRYIPRPKKIRMNKKTGPLFIWVIITIMTILFFTDLKTRRLR
jgi:hypothetical protein